MSIQNEITKRKIKHLFHFTSMENLISIMQRGFIYSRQKVDELKLVNDGFYTGDFVDHMDDNRLDGLRDYVNLSLSRPNWYLLNKYQQKLELQDLDWCIIQLSIAPMLDDETLYSVCNAASAAAKRYKVSSGDDGFKKLFLPEVNNSYKTYTRTSLPEHFTTDIQAEVLIKDAIDIRHIESIYLPTKAKMAQYQSAFKILKLNADLFRLNEAIFLNPMLK